MVIVLVVGVGGIFMLFAVMALCYRSQQNINTFLLPRKIFSTFPFLSPAAALTFFFLPDSFAESDHSQYPLVSIIPSTAAFLTLLQNFSTFLDAFLVVFTHWGNFSFPPLSIRMSNQPASHNTDDNNHHHYLDFENHNHSIFLLHQVFIVFYHNEFSLINDCSVSTTK